MAPKFGPKLENGVSRGDDESERQSARREYRKSKEHSWYQSAGLVSLDLLFLSSGRCH